MKKLLTLAALLSFSLFSAPASACRFQQLAPEILLKNSAIAFVGKSTYVEGDKSSGTYSKFTVLHPVKGVARDSHYDVISSASSCGLNMDEGQTWLILGQTAHVGVHSDQPNGSFLLTDRSGKPVCDAWKYALQFDSTIKSIMPLECMKALK